MDTLTDEHRMLQESLHGILSNTPEPAAVWRQLADLGMLCLTLPEEDGGAGLGLPELMLFARSLGRACATTPFLGSEILAVPLLADIAGHPAVPPLLFKVARGERIVTMALDDLVPVAAAPLPDGGFRLDGAKMLVPAGGKADAVVLTASLNGVPALFLLDPHADGVGRTPYSSGGPFAGADLTLEGTVLGQETLLAEGPEAQRLIADARARGQLAICADMLGGMEELLEQTLDYLRTRQQFGQPLASCQALQHAAVDMYVDLETARAMVDYGTRMFGAAPTEKARALDAVKFKLNTAAKAVGESAVQLHGGIGMTQESLTGRLFARLSAERLAFGNSRSCLNRLTADGTSIALS